ncbi:hypothetical protein RIF29_39928 [Crotalaria pallida]|uniref:Uncharacterized protein n=1 Tax=Crotalaria pallida TaxID=3830 RepID=A0AAN9E2L4_CROPI
MLLGLCRRPILISMFPFFFIWFHHISLSFRFSLSLAFAPPPNRSLCAVARTTRDRGEDHHAFASFMCCVPLRWIRTKPRTSPSLTCSAVANREPPSCVKDLANRVLLEPATLVRNPVTALNGQKALPQSFLSSPSNSRQERNHVLL